jgi:uncharacterized protein (DUF58 family)
MLRGFYISDRFFLYLALAIILMATGYLWMPMLYIGLSAAGVLVLLLTLDTLMLWSNSEKPEIVRQVPEKLSMGDANTIELKLTNPWSVKLFCSIAEEAPDQLQLRDLKFNIVVAPDSDKHIRYSIRPTTRGEYLFGYANLFIRTIIGLAERRIRCAEKQIVPAYPSVLQMKTFELKVQSRTATLQGIKRLRRIGQSSEFEQIRNYVQGDEIKRVNWRASGRRNELMVNQYEDERAQNIYSLIDKGRVMKSPFHGLSLLDHAINSALVISNISMMKGDRAGLITFNEYADTVLQARRGATQLKLIGKSLYNQSTTFVESNYRELYHALVRNVRSRSMLILYTDFESLYNLQRVLPTLRMINKLHLLVVIFFEDTELKSAQEAESGSNMDVYVQTMMQRFSIEKELIVSELNKYGIQSVLTPPDQLNINVINKYLELKSRGMI